MRKPLISIIMPVHNGMPFAREAVESILGQTYKNIELIVVNDGSTDSTAKYLRKIKDKKCIVISNIKNLGIAKSLNIAIKRAKGEFIARMDADDISLLSRIQEQVTFMQKNPEIDLCGTWAQLIDENGKSTGTKKYPIGSERIKSLLYLYNPLIHPTYLGKKIFFDEVGAYDTKYEYAEDYELLMRARQKYKITNIPRILLKFRISKNQRSKSKLVRVDTAELKVKLKYVNLSNVYSVLGILKKIFTTYLIPPKVKILIFEILNR